MKIGKVFSALCISLSIFGLGCQKVETSKITSVQTALTTTPPLWVSEVKSVDASTGIFLGSPSLLRLPNGDILASFDYNGPTSNTTGVYRSTDDGETWSHITDIVGLFWANLFEHNGSIYFLGTNAGTGVVARTIVISRSQDNGSTWSTPVTLFDQDIPGKAVRYHCAPTPVVIHNGRLFRAFEALDTSFPWARGYRAFTISIPVANDLMTPSNWKMSTKATYNAAWDPTGSESTTGWIEGNMVVGPDNKLVNLIRVNSVPYINKAAIINISDQGDTASFVPQNFITFPGGLHKFVIRKDETSGVYLAMVNNNTAPSYIQQRNILSLYGSYNLRDWTHLKTLMRDDQGLSFAQSVAKTGFQYPDWHFDGDNLIYLVRTAYDGAYNYHNANRITFGRLENFRPLLSLVPLPSTPVPGQPDTELLPSTTVGSLGYVRFKYRGADVEYKTVRAASGKIWLQQNLGSDRVAISSTDVDAYGHFFQWGRHDDGHQLKTPVIFNGLPSPNNPSGISDKNSAPYYSVATGGWWSAGVATDVWNVTNKEEVLASEGCDPCRIINANWRIPTSQEWQELATTENITNTASAFSSNLKLVKSGYRLSTTAALFHVNGRYWSSTPHPTTGGAALAFHFADTQVTPALSLSRAGGLTIRCIRDGQ